MLTRLSEHVGGDMAPSRNRCELSAQQAKPAAGQMGTHTPPRAGKHVGVSNSNARNPGGMLTSEAK